MSADHPTVSIEIDFDTDLAGGVGYHEQVAPSGPYAYYRLKETSGTFADASGNGHTGTGAGTVDYNETSGNPVSGDATARYVLFTTDTTRIGLTGVVPQLGQITVEAFVYVTSLAVDRFVFENDGVAVGGGVGAGSILEFWIETTGALSARAGNSATIVSSTAGDVVINTWYHVAAVFDAPARTISLYKNGALLTSAAWETSGRSSTSLSKLNTSWHWGTDSSSSKGSVHRLAEPAVYLRALPLAEFADHYAARLVPPFAGYTFTDVTDDVMFGDGLRRSFGRASELDDVVTHQTEFTLRNDDRKYEVEYGLPVALTVSGNEITDATRAVGTSGDGLSADSSFGIWEATTNLVANGGFETNSTGWTAVSSGVTRVTAQQKFGTASGEIVTSNAAANEGARHDFTATVAVYTVSAWVRGAGGGTVRMAVRDNAGAGAQTGTAATLTASWQRISLTTTNLTAATWRVYVETDAQQSITFQVDGVQAQLAPIMTPYVETDGGTAARAAGRVQAAASVLDETSGWVALRTRMGFSTTQEPSSASNPTFFSWQDSASQRLRARYVQSDNTISFVRQAGGGTVENKTSALTFSRGDKKTVVVAWTATHVRISIDGAAFTDFANTTIPTLAATLFDIGNSGTGSALDSDVLWFAAGTGALISADAATLHGYGDTDPAFNDLPGEATMVWTAADATWSAGSPYAGFIVPGRPCRVTMTQDATTYDWAFGFIEDWPQQWDRAGKFCRVPIRATCFLERLNEEDIGVRDFPEQAAGARLTTLLNAAGHPTSMRDIDTGVNTLMALVADSNTVGAHARAIARTDRGLFYIATNGDATFQDGDHRTTATRSTVSQGDLGDDIPYSAPEFHAPKNRIRNIITLRRPGGIDQTVTDQQSINQHGKKNFSDEIMLTTDALVLTRTQDLLAAFKDPHRRVQAITFNPAASPGFWEHALGVQLSDRYTWVFRPEQGASVTTDVFVEGVADSYANLVYTSKWFLSVAE